MPEEKVEQVRKLNRELSRIEKKHHRKHSNIPKEYWEYRWLKNKEEQKYYDPLFNPDARIVGQKTIESRINARDRSWDYVENLEENIREGESLFYLGGKNSGKTVLATLVMREAINQLAKSVLFVPFSQLLVEANVYLPEDISEYTEKYISPEMLCIDDIDNAREPNKKFIEYLDYILTTRRFCKSPTIVTSRISLTTLGKTLGNSIFELLSDSIYRKISILSSDDQEKDMDFIYTGHSFCISALINELKEYKKRTDINDSIGADPLQSILSRTTLI